MVMRFIDVKILLRLEMGVRSREKLYTDSTPDSDLRTPDYSYLGNMKPVVSLEDLSITERDQLSAKTSAALKKSLVTYLIPFLLLIGIAAYLNFNWNSWKLDRENLRSVLNLVLVVGAMLCGRLFVNKVLQHRKAANAWKKKVFRGKIHGIDKNTIFISNQKITLPANMVSEFKVEDEVEIGVSQVNDIVIYAIKTK